MQIVLGNGSTIISEGLLEGLRIPCIEIQQIEGKYKIGKTMEEDDVIKIGEVMQIVILNIESARVLEKMVSKVIKFHKSKSLGAGK